MKQDAVYQTAADQDAVAVGPVRWKDALPVLWLFQTLRLAFAVQTLVPAAAGLLLLTLLAPHSPHRAGAETDTALPPASRSAAITAPPESRNAQPRSSTFEHLRRAFHAGEMIHLLTGILDRINPLHALRSPMAGLQFGLALALTAWMGVAVCASAGHDYCLGRRLGAVQAIKLSIQQSPAWLTSTLIALLLLGLIMVPVLLTGWLTSILSGVISPAGVLFQFLWLLTAGITLVAMLLSLVVVGGWQLSLAAIGIDRCSGPDALSRGICYCLSHRARTLGYAAIVAGLVWGFCVMGRLLAIPAALVTAGLLTSASAAGASLPLDASVNSSANMFLTGVQSILLFSSAYCGTTMTYLLLRQREDGVVLQEHHLNRTVYGVE